MASLHVQEPIAIVGLACRLPGEITSPSELWTFLEQEKSAHSDYPANRIKLDSWYHPNDKRPGSINTKGGFFLGQDDSFRQFDPLFFGISPLEAATMDPQQRKMLEVVYESFESAGLKLQDVSGSNIGCFVGNFTFDHGLMQNRDVDHWNSYQMTGTSLTILSNRVNYVFNLKGPSLTLDTACSSTMYALHLACQSLQAGDCSAAVVGGTNLMMGIEQTIGSVRLQTVSPTSVSHTFDESADGYARAEAVGSIYIKRLSDAVRDGDPIRAVIRGTAINTNGKGPGISHPSTVDQETVIRKAYANAGLGLEDTAYFEAHGTGTSVGDPIEVAAIGRVFASQRSPQDPLLIGAVKTNLGHGEAASAIPSLLKVVLSLESASIPATIGIKRLNPKLDLQSGALRVVQKMTPWPKEHVHYRRASVNSFGFGGANAHAVLDATDSYLDSVLTSFKRLSYQPTIISGTNGGTVVTSGSHVNGSTGTVERPRHLKTYLVPFSAHNAETLSKNIEALLGAAAGKSLLRDFAYTLSTKRGLFSERACALMAQERDGQETPLTVAQTIEAKSTLKFGTAHDNGTSAPSLAFVFTGQGAQWAQMGAALIDNYPSVRKTITDMNSVLAALPTSISPGWTILETLAEPKTTSKINDADRSQTVCTALQIAVFNLLKSWGIQPRAVAGHSSGEIAAAYAAGYLTSAQAITVAYLRGLAVSRNNRPGAMLAVGLGEDAVAAAIKDVPDIIVACHNSPKSVTLSGTVESIDKAHDIFVKDGAFSRKLLTAGNAYHSWLMQAAGADYEALLQRHLSEDALPSRGDTSVAGPVMFSSVFGNAAESQKLPLIYWRNNLESQVLFDQAVQALNKQMPEVHCLVEVGPHSALSGAVKDIGNAVRGSTRSSLPPLQYLPSLKRNGDGVLDVLDLAGSLFLAGHAVDLGKVNAEESVQSSKSLTNGASSVVVQHESGVHLVDLPPYQWYYDPDQKPYWAESRLSTEVRFREYPRHDLLGSMIPGCSKSSPSWRNIIRADDLPWLRDHTVGGEVVFPAAGYICLAMVAATQAAGLPMSMSDGPGRAVEYALHNVTIGTAMVLRDGVGMETIVDLRSTSADGLTKFDFTVSSVSAGTWTSHASGSVEVDKDAHVAHSTAVHGAQPLGHTYGVNQGSQDKRWYETWRSIGLDYGPAFRVCSNIRSTWSEDEAVANVALHATKTSMVGESWYPLHPTAIDGCLQTSLVAYHAGDPHKMTKAHLPVEAKHMKVLWDPAASPPESRGIVRVQTTSQGLRSFRADMELATSDGRVLFQGDMSTMSSEMSGDLSSSLPHPYARLVWKPDIDQLTSDQADSLFSMVAAPDQEFLRNLASNVEEMAALATLDTVERLPRDLDVDKLPSHMAKFVRSLKRHTQSLSSTELGQLSAADRKRRYDHFTDEVLKGVPEAGLVAMLNRHMPEIVSGQTGALDVMLQDNLLTRLYEEGLSQIGPHDKLKKLLELISHKDPCLSILEVGAGTGGATRPILAALNGRAEGGMPPSYTKYCFTDVSTAFLSAASDKFGEYPNMEFQLLDIERDPCAQDFEEASFDLIFAANAIHATRDITESLQHCRKLLKPGGRLVLIETTKNRLVTNFMLGTLPGFWLGDEDGRPDGPFISKDQWIERFAAAGFDAGASLGLDDIPHPDTFSTVLVARNLDDATTTAVQTRVSGHREEQEEPVWLLYRHEPHALLAEIERVYRERSMPTRRCALTHFDRTISAAGTRKPRTILLAELEEEPMMSRLNEAEMEALRAYTQRSGTAVWVTNAGFLTGRDPEKMISLGVGTCFRIEQPSFQLASIDVDVGSDAMAMDSARVARSARLVVDTEERFHKNPVLGGTDSELVERDGVIYVSRYLLNPRDNVRFGRLWRPTAEKLPVRSNLSLVFGQVGRLESYYFREEPASKCLGATDVLVESRAFGLSRINLALMKGRSRHPFLALEMGGIVAKTGPGVKSLRSGDTVVYLKPNNLETSSVIQESICCRLRDDGTLFDMVGQLLPFTVALHTLRNLCHIRQGDRVMVDLAPDSTRHAVIQVALLSGVTVFATFTSAADKDALAAIKGVNLVDGTTAPESGNYRAILSNGRHLEQCVDGKKPRNRGAAHLVMFPGQANTDWSAISSSFVLKGFNLSYFDPLEVCLWDQSDVTMALRDAVHLIQEHLVVPVPHQTFDLSRFPDAATLVDQEPETTAALTCSPESTVVPVQITPESLTFDGNAFYLLVGCLGGLGRTLVFWMISRGARNFIFLSRSGADKPAAAQFVRELHDMSAHKHKLTIHVVRGDVSKRGDVAAAIAAAGSSPIRGVVQAAMVLKDMLFSNMALDVWNSVVQPKCLGTTHLHELLRDCDLDFFCMTSSVLGTIGAAMQSNYAAGNAFLDAMARHRHSLGLQATSIALGMIVDAGHVEEHPDVEKTLTRNGLYRINVAEYLLTMEAAMLRRDVSSSSSTGSAGDGDGGSDSFFAYDPCASAHFITGIDPTRVPSAAANKNLYPNDSRLRHIMYARNLNQAQQQQHQQDGTAGDHGSSDQTSHGAGVAGGLVRTAAAEGGGEEAVTALVLQFIMERLAKLVLMPMSKLSPGQPLSSYGMDSMISAELRSWIWNEFKADVPFMTLLEQTLSFEALAGHVVKAMDLVELRST